VIAEFLASPAGLAVKAALAAAFLDFVTGVWRAWRDDRLALDQLAAFVRKHLAGRVLPLTILAVAAYVSDDAALIASTIAGLGAYAIETTASVYAALGVPGSSRIPTA
jgi:hypothetical protein